MTDIDHPIRDTRQRPMYEWLAVALRTDLAEIEDRWHDGQSFTTLQPYERDSVLVAIEMLSPVDRADFDDEAPHTRIPVGFEQIATSHDTTMRCARMHMQNILIADNGSPVMVKVLDGNVDIDIVAVSPDIEAREQVLASIEVLVETTASTWRGQRVMFDMTQRSWFRHLRPAQHPAIDLTDELETELRRNIVVPIRNFGADDRLAGRRGVLLHGRPGTGKTQALEWVQAEVAGAATVIVTTPSMFTGTVPIKDLFLMAATAAPCLVVLEDIDLALTSRKMGPFSNDALGELLQFMDGPAKVNGAFVAATTNYVGVLDSALTKRPGRFDRKIEVADATRDARLAMATMMLERIGGDLDTADAIADRTDGWSLAEMDEAAHLAVLTSLDLEEPVDLLAALTQVHRSERGSAESEPVTGYV